MQPSKVLRLIGIILASGGACIWGLLIYFGLTSPVLPYLPGNDWRVMQGPLDLQRAGSLQTGDKIDIFNGRLLDGCYYLIDSALYSAPRNVSIPITYWQHASKTEADANIVLTDPSIQEMLNRSPGYFIALVFVVAGIIIMLGGVIDLPHLLIGLTLLSLGVMFAGWQNYNKGPLSIIALWGVPVSAILMTVTHAIWPVNQLKRPVARVAIIIAGAMSLVNMLSYLPGSTWFGCYQSQMMEDYAETILSFTFPGEVLIFFFFLYFIISAYRLTKDPFSRLQIRAIAWAILLGFGLQILFQSFASSWSPIGDASLFFAGIIPITYLFIFYRGELLFIDRYLNRLVFTFLFFVFWVIVTLALAKGVLFWQPGLDSTLVALIVSLLSLLAATFVRERLGMLVDLVLYGIHYDYETVVSHLGQSLAGVVNEARFAQVVVQQLPQALSIRYAALWLVEAGERLRLVDRSNLDRVQKPVTSLIATSFPPGSAEVEIYTLPFRVEADPTPWQAILRLYADAHLVGIILLGAKYRENTYSERDARTLQTLVGWIATTAANLAHLAERERAIEREHRLMLALAENEERLVMGVARELHDQGISALGIVRLMVEQERSRSIISAGLEQVIANLRELSDNQLSPQGLSQGLPQALSAMVETQRQLGLPVFLEVAESYKNAEQPSSLVSRELFYIAQEAVVNALKHAAPTRVEISLSCLDGNMLLRIWNDGRTFDVAPMLTRRETRGMGIMQARASRIGGQWTISSSPNSGTEICVSLAKANP